MRLSDRGVQQASDRTVSNRPVISTLCDRFWPAVRVRGMRLMARRSPLALCLLLALQLPVHVLCQDDADPSAALDDDNSKTHFGAGDVLNSNNTIKNPTKNPINPPVPTDTKDTANSKGGDFDLADALNPDNDISGKGKNKGQGGGFSDEDLTAVSEDNTYKPDKGKGGPPGGSTDKINQYDDNSETTAEVGTIAGIVSAVAMALVGAVSSYISYQKKKLCFSIQQSLNTDMVKAENPEAVVATEPQVQQTLLEPASAEPPTEENVV